MSSTKKQLILLVAIFMPLIGFILYGVLDNYDNEKLLKNESEVTHGVITETYIGTKARDFLKYEFRVNDSIYDGHQRYYPQYENIKIGDTCMVLYARTNPEINELKLNDKEQIILKK